jgi:AhpD family alkylhydroperoxidase
MKELVSIAAAVAVNCPTNLRKHVDAGHTVGVRDEEMQLVVGLAKMIRGKAMEKIDDTVKELSAPAQAEACCGPAVSVKSAPQPQAASGCCGPSVSVQSSAQPVQAAAKGSCC